jgi:Na+-driven multidrug efflux pump
MSKVTSMIIKIEIILMIISGTLLFIFAPNLLRLFSKDAKVIALASVVLRMVAVSEPFYGVSIIIEGEMQGVGETVIPFKFNIIGMWGVRIIGTLIFTQLIGMGLPSAWGCMIAHNVLLFTLFLIHYKRGNWNPLITK